MFQPFAKLLCAALLASSALAQNVLLALPTSGTDVKAGSNITVKIDKPMTISFSQEVSVVIGAFPCSGGTCPDPSDILGYVLYSGPYDPQLYPGAWNPYENFTVTVPSWYSGVVQLSVAHFFLVGAGMSPFLQFVNATLNVASSA